MAQSAVHFRSSNPPRRASVWGWRAWNAVQLAYTLAWTAGCISLTPLFLPFGAPGRRVALRAASCLWAPGLLRGARARLQVDGLQHLNRAQACVFVANHQSMIDVCALFRVLPVPLRFILKQELARVPFVGWFARAMGMVFIDRHNARAAAQSLTAAVSTLREGGCVCAFPEGTRSADGALAPFKAGAFALAIAAGVPVVPIAIEGSGVVLPPAGFRVRPGTIKVHIGTPIATTGRTARDRNVIAREARAAVLTLLHAGHADAVAPALRCVPTPAALEA